MQSPYYTSGLNESVKTAYVHNRSQAGVLRVGYRRGFPGHGDLARRRRRAFRSERNWRAQDESVARSLHGGIWARFSHISDRPHKAESVHAGRTRCWANLFSPQSEIVTGILNPASFRLSSLARRLSSLLILKALGVTKFFKGLGWAFALFILGALLVSIFMTIKNT